LKDKEIGVSYLGVTLDGTQEASIESRVVEKGIEFFEKREQEQQQEHLRRRQ